MGAFDGVPVGGWWVCPQEPTELDSQAMLKVAPNTYDWRIPDRELTARESASVDLAPPEGSAWN